MTKEELKHIFLKSVIDLRNKDLLEQDSLLDVFEDVIKPYISGLEQQIEKMKCCENCKHKKSEVDRCELLMYTMNACLCKNKDKWEIKE